MKGNDIRVGNVLIWKSKLWSVLKTQHTQPGKGGAYVQVEMKDVQTGVKVHERFRSSETVEKAFLEERTFQFLYQDQDHLVIMDKELFHQSEVSASMLPELSLALLTPGADITVLMHEDKIVSLKLQGNATVTIHKTEPFIKGQTATQSFKAAWLESGTKIMVPPHITEGTGVTINAETGEYIGKVGST